MRFWQVELVSVFSELATLEADTRARFCVAFVTNSDRHSRRSQDRWAFLFPNLCFSDQAITAMATLEPLRFLFPLTRSGAAPVPGTKTKRRSVSRLAHQIAGSGEVYGLLGDVCKVVSAGLPAGTQLIAYRSETFET